MSESSLAQPAPASPSGRRSEAHAAVLQALAAAPSEGMSAVAIMAATGIASRDALDLMLMRMAAAGEITRVRRGRYVLAPAGTPRQKRQPSETGPAEPTLPTKLVDHGELLACLIDAAGGNVDHNSPDIRDVRSIAAMIDWDGFDAELDVFQTIEQMVNPRFGGKRPPLKSWGEFKLLEAMGLARRLRLAREAAFDSRVVHGARRVSPGNRDQVVKPAAPLTEAIEPGFKDGPVVHRNPFPGSEPPRPRNPRFSGEPAPASEPVGDTQAG
jgi:hypothetical protein